MRCSYVSVSLTLGVAEFIVIMLLYRVGSKVCFDVSGECVFSIIVVVSLVLNGRRNYRAGSWRRFWSIEATCLEEEAKCVHS